jgi:hypothetical protein
VGTGPPSRGVRGAGAGTGRGVRHVVTRAQSRAAEWHRDTTPCVRGNGARFLARDDDLAVAFIGELVNKAKLRRRRQQIQGGPQEGFDFESWVAAPEAQDGAGDGGLVKSHVGESGPYLRESVRLSRRSSTCF